MPDCKSLILQSLIDPSLIKILEMDEWTFVAHVEDINSGGIIQTFSLLLLAPNGKLCLVNMKLNIFTKKDSNKI